MCRDLLEIIIEFDCFKPKRQYMGREIKIITFVIFRALPEFLEYGCSQRKRQQHKTSLNTQ